MIVNPLDNIINELVDSLCKPLFAHTPIDYFDYSRFYDDGQVIALSSNPAILDKMFELQLYPSHEELFIFCNSGLKVAVLSHALPLSYGPDLNPLRYKNNIHHACQHNIYHRIYFINQMKEYYLAYGFGVTNETKAIIPYYLNALPLLERFCRYFERHVPDLIAMQHNKKKVIVPYYHEKKIILTPSENDAFEKLNFNISLNSTSIISDREKSCLALYSQGYTMKAIAEKLSLSPRTVEMHLRNIKKKHHIKKKNQLVDIWREYYQ